MKTIHPLFILLLLYLFSSTFGFIIPSSLSADELRDNSLRERTKQGITIPITGAHLNWFQGFHWVSRNENLILKIGGKFALDTGDIDPNDSLDNAFPDLAGYETIIRTATLAASGRLFKSVDFKLEFDFANSGDVQDNWIRFKPIPYLGLLQIGHFKEPFSLESQGSINHRTFMESPLPTQAFSPGRNLGLMLFNQVLGNRVTWEVGAFYNIGSFSTVGNAKDKILAANGYDITARIVGRPWYSTDGRQLLHLGLSYNYGFRDGDPRDSDDRIQIRTRPETRLTDDRLADTGQFIGSRINKINAELAAVVGPFSLQGEWYYDNVDTAGQDLAFWGYYLQGSAVLTGENRGYDTLRGIFTGITPKRSFNPLHGEWGAWELAGRLSYLDLNDGFIKGGEELNLTAGLNGYLRSNVRVMFNYTRAKLENRRDPLVESGWANIVQARFQFFF